MKKWLHFVLTFMIRETQPALCRSHWKFSRSHEIYARWIQRIEFMRPVAVVCPPLTSEGRTPVKVSCINPKSAILAFVKARDGLYGANAKCRWARLDVIALANWARPAVLIAYQSWCTARLIRQLKRAARCREATRLATRPAIWHAITPANHFGGKS